MDQEKADMLQELLDITTEHINELALDTENAHLTAVDMFQIAVQNALIEYHNNTVSKQYTSPIGRVDTRNVAFCLQDKDTVAVLQGDHDFAEMIEMDYVGIDNEEEQEDEEY